MQNIFHDALQALNNVPASAWDIVIQTIISAVTVSPIALGIKKWFSIESEKKMMLIVMVGSFITGASAYLLTVPEFAPWIIIVQSWLIYATTQPVYFLFIKPIFKRLGVWFTDQVSKATMVHEAKAAAVPPEGLPIVTPIHDTFAD